MDGILSLGHGTGSVSLYMAHGGTSFGFWNGANGGGGASYQPDITSYDYDSPLAEGGEHGYGSAGHDKYAALSAVFAKHRPANEPAPPAEPPLRARAAFGPVPLTERAALLDGLDVLTTATRTGDAAPPAIETLGCAYGFVVYEADVPADHAGMLTFPAVRDRVQVFAAGRYAGTAYRVTKQSGIPFDSGGVEAGTRLTLLVENMGRINFSRGGMADTRRGLLGNASAVLLDGKPLPVSYRGWSTRCLPLEPAQLAKLQWAPRGNDTSGPAFYRASFATPGGKAGLDTYLTLPGFTKGAAWVNGFALGRHWEAAGPQKTLYVPGPVVKGSGNELVVLELHNTSATGTAVFVDAADI